MHQIKKSGYAPDKKVWFRHDSSVYWESLMFSLQGVFAKIKGGQDLKKINFIPNKSCMQLLPHSCFEDF